MGKSKKQSKGTLPKELVITEEEEIYRMMFDFAYYLENLPRGSVSGATELLRLFLRERKGKENGKN